MLHKGKCPCCGYEFDWHWGERDEVITKGDESFIEISCFDKPFETDKAYEYDYRVNVKVYLYGCPKCGGVHYKEF